MLPTQHPTHEKEPRPVKGAEVNIEAPPQEGDMQTKETLAMAGNNALQTNPFSDINI